MLTVYGSVFSPPSNKVRFAANALGIPYDYREVNLRAGDQRKADFLKINPVGKVPAIVDDGFKLFESNAIIRYLAEREQSSLMPKALKERAIVDQWMDFTTLHIAMNVGRLYFNRIVAAKLNIPVDTQALVDGEKFLESFLPIVEERLSESAFIAGPVMTIADINMLAALDPAEVSQINLSVYPKLAAWRSQLQKEDFYTKCYSSFADVLK